MRLVHSQTQSQPIFYDWEEMSDFAPSSLQKVVATAQTFRKLKFVQPILRVFTFLGRVFLILIFFKIIDIILGL